MLITITMYSIITVLIMFIAVGFILTISAIKEAGRQNKLSKGDGRCLSLHQRAKRYEGPIQPDMPFFNPTARVSIEFISAICGFPGLGWIVSGNVFIGIILMSIIPAFVWAFFPVYATMTGALASSPFVFVRYLPAMALASASCLAINQIIAARRRGEKVER